MDELCHGSVDLRLKCVREISMCFVEDLLIRCIVSGSFLVCFSSHAVLLTYSIVLIGCFVEWMRSGFSGRANHALFRLSIVPSVERSFVPSRWPCGSSPFSFQVILFARWPHHAL